MMCDVGEINLSETSHMEKGNVNSENNNLIENSDKQLSEENEENEKFSEALADLPQQCSETKINLDVKKNDIIELEMKISQLENSVKEAEAKVEYTTKLKELAIKEKEAMVIRYAVSEKHVLVEKQQKEHMEKKLKEAMKENDILQHKVQTMMTEKSRICQMLDNKCHEHRSTQQELEKVKADIQALETKLKWSQTSLKTEIDLHKKSQEALESQTAKLKEATSQIELVKKESQEFVKNYYTSQENRAHVLDQQLKEQQAALILTRHEKEEKDQQLKSLQTHFDNLQAKQKEVLQENNNLFFKVQQLERDRLEMEQKLSELRVSSDQQRQDTADLQSVCSQLDQCRLQLKNEQDQMEAAKDQMNLLKQRNSELESDMAACREKEAELLLFTQQLTAKNVRLQSEFTALETKVQQLTCEQTMLKRTIKEQETKIELLKKHLIQERKKFKEENDKMSKELEEKSHYCEKLKQEIADQKGETAVIKRKLELSLREVNRELQHCRKRLELHESLGHTTSNSSSNSSLSMENKSNGSTPTNDVKIIQSENELDKQTLIDHIVKLHRISIKKSEKIDFLEEHVNTLVAELQKKTRLLQGYILRDQSGTLTSNSMDHNKANLAKLNGVMASMYSCRVADDSLTLELSLDINRKLQAVLEDVLLKNITLKENVDTLGKEIDRLNQQLKT